VRWRGCSGVDGMFRSIYVRIANQRLNPLCTVRVQSCLSIPAIRSIFTPSNLLPHQQQPIIQCRLTVNNLWLYPRVTLWSLTFQVTRRKSNGQGLRRCTTTLSTQIFNPPCPPICNIHSLTSLSSLPSSRFPSGVIFCSQTMHSKPSSLARGSNVA
jgi:hypothetical protein